MHFTTERHILKRFQLRLAGLLSFLVFERRERSIRDRERHDLELAMIAIIMVLMAMLHHVPHAAPVLLNLFFLPVSVSAMYLGRRRSGGVATMCILATIFVMLNDGLPLGVLAFVAWAGVLVLASRCIGTLSDELYGRFNDVYEAHASEMRTDALTGVANRRSFDATLQRNLQEAAETQHSFCLALLDIDHFKRFNDTYGHQAGDKVLHDVARSLEATVRTGDFVARYGGEEFAIMMPCTSLHAATQVIEQVRLEIEATRFFFQRSKLRLTVSIGLCQWLPGEEARGLIQRADDALYTSKQAGRNCLHVHTGEICERFGDAAPRLVDSSACGALDAQSALFADEVTGLPSNQVFLAEVARRICEVNRYGSQFSIVMLRLSCLAELQEHGVETLNRALTIVGELLSGTVRETDLVSRYNSDCFAIMMPFTSARQARAAVKRLIKEVHSAESVRVNGSVVKLQAVAAVCAPAGGTAHSVANQLVEQTMELQNEVSACTSPDAATAGREMAAV